MEQKTVLCLSSVSLDPFLLQIGTPKTLGWQLIVLLSLSLSSSSISSIQNEQNIHVSIYTLLFLCVCSCIFGCIGVDTLLYVGSPHVWVCVFIFGCIHTYVCSFYIYTVPYMRAAKLWWHHEAAPGTLMGPRLPASP